MKNKFLFQLSRIFVLIYLGLAFTMNAQSLKVRSVENFCNDWKFHLGDIANGNDPALNDDEWRKLDLPHDWSIEGEFSKDHPATPGGGALPGGIGWYRKSFFVPESEKEKLFFIDFDGIYRNSEVWINGNYLGKRPYGYISFRYELTPYLKFGDKNVIAVKVDNSQQPNSRWYSGSGIYRNVWLTKTNKIYVEHWGTFITTPTVNEYFAKVSIQIKVRNIFDKAVPIKIITEIFDSENKKVGEVESQSNLNANALIEIHQEVEIKNPKLWSIEKPNLYRAISIIESEGKQCDDYETIFGIRTFEFNAEKGFFLNGKQVKIKGVCNHHDLGCLGAAINERALERQLEILKNMGVNAIRTSHNPPAPELLNLCDRMGFIVMDEAFDMWKTKKTEFDYALDWDKWYKRDLEDMILRDRNHPSVIIWSIGNEVMEQWIRDDSIGIVLTKELTKIVKSLDSTRPVTAACNGPEPENPLIKAEVLDLIGFNYHHHLFEDFPKTYPNKKFIATETTSALATRGHYDMPSDSIRRWPKRWDLPLEDGNPDNTCSAYDNCSAPWGSTHEETWRIIKKHDFLSGMFIWTGFDYLGEPTPYSWPSRSSYFGIVDLAGFPKDVYYMYQSEWTDKPILHVFPHWNWKEGQIIDVWAYTNCDEVELFLNGNSMGIKRKSGDDIHLMWRLKFIPGILKAVGRKDGKEILTRQIKTADKPYKIYLEADRNIINADGKDLSFVTVKILDKDGTLVPYADNLINFEITGEGKIAGVDNGSQTSHEPFKANYRKAFNGMCLAVIQSSGKAGKIKLTAKSENLLPASIEIEAK
ncbi:MAG: beta-galactosidase GalB [Melioribacter sp.]|uniref:beta-galactosidase GalB n=1 Tax=Rosettibacter primus TaxID=3111523 RepID=UPI00247C4300|nr:beta-galactosidase GalB [Melioribacter sp.]